MKLAIITSTLNEYGNIKRHLDYLNTLCLSYNVVYVIADGGSTDETQSLVRKLSTDKGIFLENSGSIYDSWNKSLDTLSSDVTHVVFLGVGDRLDECFLDGAFSNNDSHIADLITCGVQIGEKLFPIKSERDIEHLIFSSLFACIPTHHSGTIFSRSLFHLVGAFNSSYKVSADLDWFIRLRKIRTLKIISFYFYGVFLLPGGVSSGGPHAIRVLREDIKISLVSKRLPCLKRVLYLLVSYLKFKASLKLNK
jgi:glycosyltransferase involved in cell wall biosynthesis